MVINASDESKSGILKSSYNSISIPLKFPAFQDCIEYHRNNDYKSTNHYEHLKEFVGCHFVDAMPTNITSLSDDNITLIHNQPEECSWSWTEGDNHHHSGVFEVTMKKMMDPVVNTKGISGSIPEISKPVTSDVVLALTCDACFKQPCAHKNKDSRVTFAIPFILTNKQEILEPYASPKHSHVSISILAVSVSFLLFIAIIIIVYQWLKRSRDKR